MLTARQNPTRKAPRGGRPKIFDPLKINQNGVGESDVIFMGDRLYYITKDSYSEIMRYRNQMIKPDTKFKLLTVCLAISNAVTLALASDAIYSKIIVTLSFVIIASTLLLSLKNMSKEEVSTKEATPESRITRSLSEKEIHKKKTALAMLRQLEN